MALPYQPRSGTGQNFRATPKIRLNQAPLSKGAVCGQSPQTGGLPPGKLPPPGPRQNAPPSVNGISRRNNPSVLASLGHLPLTREAKTNPAAANRADMESAPTEVCSNAWPRPSRSAQNIKFIRRGGIHPARERLRHRGVRRGEGTPPYERPGGCSHPGRPQHPPPFVGADSISARGLPRRRTPIFSRQPRNLPCRAGVHARRTAAIQNRGVPAAARFAGRCKHRPLQGFVIAHGRSHPGRPQHRRGCAAPPAFCRIILPFRRAACYNRQNHPTKHIREDDDGTETEKRAAAAAVGAV